MGKKRYTTTIIQLSDILDKKKFRLPLYQRNVVWKKKRRKTFIDNVRKGDPFGVILIRDDKGIYTLIDGLQRVSTIKDYLNKPFDYLVPEDVNKDLIIDLIKKHYKSISVAEDEEAIEKTALEWQKKFYECLEGRLENYEVMTAFREEYAVKDIKEINDAINAIYKDFEDSTDISWVTVDAINYMGPVENIPNIFYNLNTGGIGLSKYETFAALWDGTKFKVDDDEIISVIKNKYETLEEKSDLDVDFNEENLREEGITLFEFCYSLSGILREKEILFGKTTKSTDPMGFEILSLLFEKNVNQAHKLYDRLSGVSGEYLVKIKNTILEAVEYIEGSLKVLLEGLNDSYLTSDSMYLIYHILSSYILEYYSFDINNEKIIDVKSDLKKADFKKYAKYHYLYDCMTDYWNNHRQVTDLNNAIINDDLRHKYWHKIKSEDWVLATTDFMDNQKMNSNKVTQKNKLFIDYITKEQLNKNPQYNKYFMKEWDGEKVNLDIEHIAAQKRVQTHIKDLSKDKQKSYPVSDVGNLCYLSMRDNRAKKELTLYEFVDDRPAYATDEDYRKAIFYPDEADIGFLDYNNQEFREAYEKYLNERHKYLQSAFLEFINGKK